MVPEILNSKVGDPAGSFVIPCHQDLCHQPLQIPKASSRCGGATSREPFVATFSALHLRSDGIPLFTSSDLFNSLFIVVRNCKSEVRAGQPARPAKLPASLIPGQPTPTSLIRGNLQLLSIHQLTSSAARWRHESTVSSFARP